jgi:hypothetical protein
MAYRAADQLPRFDPAVSSINERDSKQDLHHRENRPTPGVYDGDNGI